MINGLLNVYKEAGFTSNDVVSKLRGILHQKKIGHTGTLDPDAVGVLVVCLGTGTKLVEQMMDHDKEYIAVARLGVTTDTEDMSGKVLTNTEVHVTAEEVREALQAFKGTYEQVPPMYSALKVNGRRLYELARKGREVERAARKVRIDSISLLDTTRLASDHTFTMEVRCSRGTYIRTLISDIGERLHCGAAMEHLTRTAVGSFRLEDALTLERIQAAYADHTLDEYVLGTDALFRDLDLIHVKEEAVRLIDNGNPFSVSDIALAQETGADAFPDTDDGTIDYEDGERFRVYRPDDSFAGIWYYDARKKRFAVEKMLG